MNRFLAESPNEQSALFTREDTNTLSTFKGCLCKVERFITGYNGECGSRAIARTEKRDTGLVVAHILASQFTSLLVEAHCNHTRQARPGKVVLHCCLLLAPHRWRGPPDQQRKEKCHIRGYANHFRCRARAPHLRCFGCLS